VKPEFSIGMCLDLDDISRNIDYMEFDLVRTWNLRHAQTLLHLSLMRHSPPPPSRGSEEVD